MKAVSLTDTPDTLHELQFAHIRALTPAQRLTRALALSALAREFAWAGAQQVAGALGPDAVRHRFLVQLNGPQTADWVARRIACETEP